MKITFLTHPTHLYDEAMRLFEEARKNNLIIICSKIEKEGFNRVVDEMERQNEAFGLVSNIQIPEIVTIEELKSGKVLDKSKDVIISDLNLVLELLTGTKIHTAYANFQNTEMNILY